MSVGGLVYFRHPVALDRELPSSRSGLGHTMKPEGSRLGGMLEHTTKLPHTRERRGKTTAILIDPPAPSFVIDGAQLMPAITRRMRHDGIRSAVLPSIARYIPRIYARKIEVDALRFNK